MNKKKRRNLLENKKIIISVFILGILLSLFHFYLKYTYLIENRYPERRIFKCLKIGEKIGNYEFVFAEKLPSRCVRLRFLKNETITWVDICPKDLTEEEIEAVSEFVLYSKSVAGEKYYYNAPINLTGPDALFLKSLIKKIEKSTPWKPI